MRDQASLSSTPSTALPRVTAKSTTHDFGINASAALPQKGTDNLGVISLKQFLDGYQDAASRRRILSGPNHIGLFQNDSLLQTQVGLLCKQLLICEEKAAQKSSSDQEIAAIALTCCEAYESVTRLLDRDDYEEQDHYQESLKALRDFLTSQIQEMITIIRVSRSTSSVVKFCDLLERRVQGAAISDAQLYNAKDNLLVQDLALPVTPEVRGVLAVPIVPTSVLPGQSGSQPSLPEISVDLASPLSFYQAALEGVETENTVAPPVTPIIATPKLSVTELIVSTLQEWWQSVKAWCRARIVGASGSSDNLTLGNNTPSPANPGLSTTARVQARTGSRSMKDVTAKPVISAEIESSARASAGHNVQRTAFLGGLRRRNSKGHLQWRIETADIGSTPAAGKGSSLSPR